MRHRIDGSAGGGQSSDEDVDALEYPQQPCQVNATEDDEERQIQARLHNLMAISRNNGEGGGEDHRGGDRYYSQRRVDQRDNHRRRDNRGDESATAEKRSRRGYSPERYPSSSSSPAGRNRRERSPDRPRTKSRWDSQRSRRSPPSSISDRNRRLVDY